MVKFVSLAALAMSLLATVLVTAAAACGPQVRVTYVEDSPDFFRIEFLNGTEFELATVTLNLTSSSGRAYVDTAYGNHFSARQNGVELDETTRVGDGDQRLVLKFRKFQVGGRFNYFVDLDDRSSPRDGDLDHLTGEEMQGATAMAELVHRDRRPERISGRFDATGTAILAPKACV